jgi:hypothetical protein
MHGPSTGDSRSGANRSFPVRYAMMMVRIFAGTLVERYSSGKNKASET